MHKSAIFALFFCQQEELDSSSPAEDLPSASPLHQVSLHLEEGQEEEETSPNDLLSELPPFDNEAAENDPVRDIVFETVELTPSTEQDHQGKKDKREDSSSFIPSIREGFKPSKEGPPQVDVLHRANSGYGSNNKHWRQIPSRY